MPDSSKRGRSRRMYWLWIALIILVADQITKALVLNEIKPTRATMDVLPFLNFVYVENPGSAFGMFAGQRWPLSVLGIIVSLGLMVWMRFDQKLRTVELISICLIVGGALGNVIDRVRFGYVVDFLDFYIGDWHWFAFNIADAGITVGAALMIVASFLPPKETQA